MFEEKPAVAELSDEEILRASRRKPALFKTLIDRYELAFLRRARRILGAREEAADAVVETFTKIYLHAADFTPRPDANFRAWAYQILNRTAYTYYRQLKNRANHEVLLSEGLTDLSDADQELAEPLLEKQSRRYDTKELISRVLVRLPAQFARALALRFLADQPLKAIAAAENLSLAAVKVRLHRAKKEFKRLASCQNNV